MANLSDFDRAIKCNILRGDFKSAIDKIHDFYSQLEGRDQTVVFNALLRYYSKNEIIYSLTTKYRKNKIKDMPVVNKSDSSYSFNMFPGSEILMITPQPSSKSAGIQVFRNLTQVLRSSGLKVDELVYAKEQNLDVLFSKNKSKYDLVLIPETVSHIPKIYFQNILIYHGNKFAKLPQMQLGTLPVNPSKSINFVHSRSIDSSMKRLFLNTLNFEKFKPKSESRIGGTAIYLGKSEHDLKIRSKLSLLSKKFETNLIITRNFPETEELPSFARELDLLITLDPISSTNLEFAVSGCPVLFRNLLDYFNKQDIESFELFNRNFRFFDSDTRLLDFSSQLRTHNNLEKIALKIQEHDLREFLIYVKSVVKKSSLPS